VTAAPSTVRATTAASIARGGTVRPASLASGAADPSDRVFDGQDAQPEMSPFESAIEIASITPAPLGEALPIGVAPLTTTTLTVDEIPVASIDMAPGSPEQQK
jgi:hypothetical protein